MYQLLEIVEDLFDKFPQGIIQLYLSTKKFSTSATKKKHNGKISCKQKKQAVLWLRQVL
jgi:hypothetical protein